MKNKRILWLLNHTTLRDFEVPLLIDLGFEVFTPKIIPNDKDPNWRSGSVTFEYDQTLSITKNNLELLNNFNFYSDLLSSNVSNIINEYFSIVICGFFPTILESVFKKTNCLILMRGFGLDEKSSYTKNLKFIDKKIYDLIEKRQHRFYFAQAYEGISSIESNLFKDNTIFLPLGLGKSFYVNQNTWEGGVKKILFICPSITALPTYYGKIYTSFKFYLGDLPHVIGGTQPTPVEDENVLGFQPREQFDRMYKDYCVMFYHSREPRHLHYHPLEAIVYGMPLVYMSGGLLESLGGTEQPGMCHTEQDARQKIERILNGDSQLINDIRKQQKKILESFSYDYCKAMWEKNFLPAISEIKPNLNKSRIAVFLPAAYRGGSMQVAKNLAKMFCMGAKNDNESIEIVFSCLKDTYDVEEDFADLLELGIAVRESEWKKITKAETQIALEYLQSDKKLIHDEYLLPTDGINNFSDCDFWLIVSDRTFAPVAPVAPYGMVIYDYIQRYIPDIFGDDKGDLDAPFIASARNAEIIFCTTPQTREDTIQYAGVVSEKVILAPMEFNPLTYTPKQYFDEPMDYFIWTSNSTQHKNHINALKAFEHYYQELNGSFKVIMTGVRTELFQKDNSNEIPYIIKVRDYIQKHSILRNNIIILGELSENDYISVLSGAKFLFHPVLYDNGTFSVIEAAYHEVPSISSHYPQMRYIDERFHLGIKFFDPRKPEQIAKILKAAELEHEEMRKTLPSQAFLEQFTYEKLSSEYWAMIKGYL